MQLKPDKLTYAVATINSGALELPPVLQRAVTGHVLTLLNTVHKGKTFHGEVGDRNLSTGTGHAIDREIVLIGNQLRSNEVK